MGRLGRRPMWIGAAALATAAAAAAAFAAITMAGGTWRDATPAGRTSGHIEHHAFGTLRLRPGGSYVRAGPV